MMGVREMDRSLEQWQMGVKDLRRRMILAPTPRERERWYAMLLLAQGLTAAATAEALERDPHTVGRWAAAFGEGGPTALMFEQSGGSPRPISLRFSPWLWFRSSRASSTSSELLLPVVAATWCNHW